MIELAAGDGHCLALKTDGTVVAWGQNDFGQTTVPLDLTNAVGIAAGSTHSLALRSDGSVALWGQIFGSFVNTVPPNATNVVALALGPGAQHALALRADGSVVDWGNGGYGLTNVPPTAQNIVAVAAGAYNGVALRSDGHVVVWGDNRLGQLNVPAAATNIVAVAAGWLDLAALRADGTVLTWGSLGWGSSSSPPLVYGMTNVVDLACPFSGTQDTILGVRGSGTLTEAPTSSSTRLPVYPTNTIISVAAGSYNGLALVGSGAPVFTGLPINRSVSTGSRAYFCIGAVGAPPIFYQWTCNGTNLPGATNAVLTLTNVQPGLAGTYFALVASNAVGVATSGAMTLKETPLEITVQPPNQMVLAGTNGTATLVATATGQGPFTYQWRFNGTNIDGATNSSLVLTNLQMNQAGVYSAVGSNGFGSAVSEAAVLGVTPLFITSQPQTETVPVGTNAIFTLAINSSMPVTYQWQFNGTNLEDATNNPLILTNVQPGQAGAYSAIVSNGFGAVVSSNATLALIPLVIAAQPQDQVGYLGLTVTFSVVPVRQGPFSYQWRFNGTNIMAATDPDLVITNLQFNQAGTYSVAVSNAFGGLESIGAVLSVRQVAAWGDNTYGQTNVPLDLTNAMAISCCFHSMALRADGTVAAWGLNNDGQADVPEGLTNVTAIAAGYSHSLALKADGSLIAWGNYFDGANGYPAVPPTGLTNVVAIAAGYYHALALKADGTVAAWGYNYYGQTNVPPGLTNIVAVAANGFYCLALKADGTVVGWGGQGWGETNIPPDLSNVVAIAAGLFHGLALRADGSVVGWGDNSRGETIVPLDLTNAVAIAGGGFFSLALKPDGSISAWGIGPTNPPPDLTGATAIAAGANHSLALPGRPTLQAPIVNVRWRTDGFQLSLATQSGRVYALEFKNSLEESNWTTLPLAAGNGGMLALTDPTTTSSQRYYRVCRW